MKKLLYPVLFIVILFFNCTSNDNPIDEIQLDDKLYFPPLNSNTWETISISSLGWNENEFKPLLNYLEEKNTKGFIILYNGKIVVERYMNQHDSEKLWYWASAGKTLTTAISGIAQNEGFININNKVSDYLGTGWTSATLQKENLITCKNLLSMDSGLDDSLGDNVSKENLKYKADAGSRWAYHNVYVKMQDVISQATNIPWSTYFNSKLKDKIGMNGAWIKNNDFNVYWSNTRSMARFGLMISANGKWENTQIVPEAFLSEATNTSQDINKAYGYMWWLNGKSSFRLPASQIEFQGDLISNAPNDMYAALGKNDQKIYIAPSKKLVIVRMGNSASDINFARSDFDNELWAKLNAFITE
ncbi:serine hydrolase domain-containing protein [Gelatiniphilus marinus]|uniref:Serine hydrolase domain-containing protein n=1 Tax=Gelatiniphilus marinus TaxID=1759464 RepID=A0ABW5JSF0_9FLAO